MKYRIILFVCVVLISLGCSVNALLKKLVQNAKLQHGWAKAKKKTAEHKFGALWNFCYTVQCATGRDCFDYNGYGCWCGWGGIGTPVDGIDRCCEEHDNCYRVVNIRHGCSLGKYDDYNFECKDLGPVKKPLCSYKNSRCEELMCECDVVASECFASYPYPDKKPECPENNYKTLSLMLGRNKNYYGPFKHSNVIF